ncbi:MAG: mechanosensitive ion channel [Roseburia sp.]|nr:mechanosensitive ion channel [Roseburia sp.]
MSFISSILSAIPNFLLAIIWLVVAFVVAALVKAIVIKLLKALKAEQYLSKLGVKDTETNSSITFVGKLAYFVTFLLFLPSALNRLGMNVVSEPITRVVNSFMGFIPNLIATIIIVAVGLFVAKIVKELLVPVLKALKLDVLQEKAGIKTEENASFSVLIANVVYAIIVLVVITAGLNQLGVSAVAAPANLIVTAIFDAIPGVLAAIAIIGIGVFIARLVAKVLQSVLAGVGTDSLLEKITGTPAKTSLSKVISEVLKYVLIIVFVVEGMSALNLPVLTNIGAAIIQYMPAVLSAIIILAIGIFAANTVGALLVKKFPNAKGSALIAKAAIYVVTVFLCLSQLNIATAIVETTFILIIAALCVAFAIAFGVGGRQFASNALDKLEKKIDSSEEQK